MVKLLRSVSFCLLATLVAALISLSGAPCSVIPIFNPLISAAPTNFSEAISSLLTVPIASLPPVSAILSTETLTVFATVDCTAVPVVEINGSAVIFNADPSGAFAVSADKVSSAFNASLPRDTA